MVGKAKPRHPLTAGIIATARLCEHLHCLPGPGGLLEQDAFVMMALAGVYEADSQKQKLEQEKEDKKRAANQSRRSPRTPRKR